MKGMLKKIIIFVVVFILLVIVWNLIAGKKDEEKTLTSSSEGGDIALLEENESEVADAFLNTLLNLNTITLEGGIFSDPRFTSLVDYTVLLIPQPLGRPNPFIPVAGASASTAVSTTTVSGTTTGL